MKEGKKIFRPRARIIKSLGDELISNEFVAISELVKNAYDAGATFVKLDIAADEITISDDGKGMTLSDLQEGWFEPATNIKVKNKKLLGEKGIGRFSVVKLATQLVLTTQAEQHKAISSTFDWESFNEEDAYLDEVEVEWKETEWSEDTNTGTVLHLSGLKDDWTNNDRRQHLKTFLSRMVNPFNDESVRKFQILVRIEPDTDFEEITTSEILQHPHYTVSGSIKDGTLDLHYVGLEGRQKNLSTDISESLFGCGNFGFEFRIWDRDTDVIKELATTFKLAPKDFRDILNQAAGVSVYRDGFRVLPYGEVNNDWLRLDMRRVQNPSMRLSNNQVVGYVKISKEHNPELKDKTNREGLIENQQYDDFYNKIRDEILKVVEEERWLDRQPKREEITANRTTTASLNQTPSLDEVGQYAEATYPNDAELQKKVSAARDESQTRAETFKKLILRYRRLSTLGQLLETVIHEINNSFAKVSAQLEIIKHSASDSQKVLSKVEEIAELHSLLQKFIDRLKPFAERTNERAQKLSVKTELENSVAVESAVLSKHGITVSLPSNDAVITIKKVDLFTVFSNLLSNSIYWLQNIDMEVGRQIHIDLREDDSTVAVLFSDNGPGIEDEFKPHIFDPYFSQKKDGTGLGLSIVGEIVSDYGGALEYYEDGDLGGAAFKVTFRK